MAIFFKICFFSIEKILFLFFFYFIELLFYFHSFILYLPYIQNFTVQGWNDEIKEKVNGEET